MCVRVCVCVRACMCVVRGAGFARDIVKAGKEAAEGASCCVVERVKYCLWRRRASAWSVSTFVAERMRGTSYDV